MFRNYKIVVNTAVGRRRYLKYLLPQVLASEIVDRYDLWVNTLNKVDIAFFEAMADKFPKLNLIWQPKGEIRGIYSMADFYPFCQEDDTIYIKLDDDIVWIAPNFFEEICRFRIDNPHYFLVSPLVINNGISTFILQNQGFLKFRQYFNCQGYNMRFYNGYLAEQLHNWFIDNYLSTSKYFKLYCGSRRIAMQRFAINAVAWFGKEFNKFEGKVIGDDEEFLTVTYPAKNDLICCFDCNTIVSHFSFSVQRTHLDKTNILKRYEMALLNSGDSHLIDIFSETKKILMLVNNNIEMIESRPLPHNYKKGKVSHKANNRIRTFSTQILRKILSFIFMMMMIPHEHRKNYINQYIDLVRSKRKYFI